jgi:hypothetical protein
LGQGKRSASQYKNRLSQPTCHGTDYRNSRGSPEAAGIAGVRFRLGSNFYLEPYFRGGYPFIGGAGLTLGFRFPARSEPIRIVEVEKTVEVEFSLPDTLAIILGPDSVQLKNVKPPSGDTFSFIFAPNSTRFNDLDSAVYSGKRDPRVHGKRSTCPWK